MRLKYGLDIVVEVGRTWPEAAYDRREVEWRSRVMARTASPRQMPPPGFGRCPAKSGSRQSNIRESGAADRFKWLELVKIDSTRSALLPPW